jgi:hypothetical protein
VRKAKMRTCLSGKENVANLSPSRDTLSVDGTDFAFSVRLHGARGCFGGYLFEFVEVCFGFKVKDVGWFLVVSGWFPVFEHSARVDADDAVVDGVVGHYVDGFGVHFVERVNRI